MSLIIIYIVISLFVLSLVPHDRNIPNRNNRLIVLSGENIYITKFRLKRLVSYIKDHNYSKEIYVCGKFLCADMDKYLTDHGVSNKIVQIKSINTFEDANC